MNPAMLTRRCLFVVLAFVAVVSAIGCRQSQPEDSSILAVFDGGEVRALDLDRAILALPPGERQIQLQSPDRIETIVRRLAFKQLMKNRLLEDGLAENEYIRIIEDALRRRITVGLYLHAHFPQKPISPEEFSAWLDQHPIFRYQPPRRLVYTFFKGFTPGKSREETRQAVENVKLRVMRGEVFAQVAERESESETRHNQGLLGWISPGQVAPQLERIISTLDEGEISDPITTKDGVHLFWVKTIIEGRDLKEAELRPVSLSRSAAERRAETIDQALAKLGVSEPLLPPSEVLQTLFQFGKAESEVMTLGDWTLTYGEFHFLLQREQGIGTGGSEEFLRELARTQALRQMIEEQELLSEEEINPLVAPELEQERLTRYANLEMGKWILGEEDRLRRYFESERSRFRTPLMFHVLKMTVPLGSDPVGRMKELEEKCADPEVGVGNVRSIAVEMDGKVEDLGTGPLSQLISRDPGVLAVVSLAESALTPPRRDEVGLVVYGVLERREPTDRPFDEVREIVAASMLQEQGPDLQGEFSRWALNQVHFKLFEERLLDAGLQ
ncbi:MAG: peptidylprolyl isomerase [Thermoanaerobaculales bacterium]|nr:peptidylprolyl isomerase [Thermoanaerobaculales bacterium]